MESSQIKTVGDLISFLLEIDPNKEIRIYDYEWDIDKPLEHIDVELDTIIIYG